MGSSVKYQLSAIFNYWQKVFNYWHEVMYSILIIYSGYGNNRKMKSTLNSIMNSRSAQHIWLKKISNNVVSIQHIVEAYRKEKEVKITYLSSFTVEEWKKVGNLIKLGLLPIMKALRNDSFKNSVCYHPPMLKLIWYSQDRAKTI